MKLKTLGLLLGPVLAVAFWLICLSAGLPAPAARVAGLTALCAVWWILEPIPIPVTSLLPFALLPLLGITDHEKVARAYGHHLILLLLGGFILSGAMEKSGVHRRLALGMVRVVGTRGPRLVMGFMLAATLISMWISNTATALMLLPVAIALVQQAEDERLAMPLLLAVAYGANIGGVGSPVGTPPNLIFLAQYEAATGQHFGFLNWMKIGVPVSLLLAPLAAMWLSRGVRGCPPVRLPELGPWRKAEGRVLAVFALTALLWITRAEPAGGWQAFVADYWGYKGELIGDSTVALAMVALMFLLPDGEGERLLDWKTAEELPWGILLLFGGGIAIADAFSSTGLSAAIGQGLAPLAAWPPVLTVFALTFVTVFLTEVTSNTALATLLMPILAGAAAGAGVKPELFMVPATLAASLGFMMPVGTAPNAIVFGTKRVTMQQMVREGFAINLMAIGVTTLVCALLL